MQSMYRTNSTNIQDGLKSKTIIRVNSYANE